MIQKIKQWWLNRRFTPPVLTVEARTYTYQELEKVYQIGYNDGKRDGLNIARDQATKSLKEILWQQNHNESPSK